MRRLNTGYAYEDGSPVFKYDIVELFAEGEARWPLGIFAVVENWQSGKWFLVELEAATDVTNAPEIELTQAVALRLERKGGLYVE